LVHLPASLAHYTFRQACCLPACPQTETVVNWLKNNPARIGPVVEPDLTTTPQLIFDLSVGSPDLASLADRYEVKALTNLLFDRIKDAGTGVGIGRYNEARQIYTNDLFKVSGNDYDEWRTIHLAIDLFMETGAPVFAPLDGKIHSFRHNASPLDYGPTVILEHEFEAGAVKFFSLYGHLSLDSLDGLYVGKPVKKGALIARIGAETINGGWPPHLHFQLITDLLERVGEFPGVARPSQRDIWLSLCPDPNLILGIPATCFPAQALSQAELLDARREHLGKSLSVSYKKPLKIVRGYMQYLYDEDGRAYLDAVNNVPHVGHCHPRVVRAAQQQMAVLNTNTRYLHDNLVRYARRLGATLPAPLRVCFFVNSGSEANDLALRLARAYTGQHDVVIVDGAYHGNLTSLVEISPYKFDGPGGKGAPPHTHKVDMPDIYRGAYKAADPQAGQKYARQVRTAVEQIQQQGRNVAAFFCESILSCGGQIVLPENYLREAYHYIRQAGGVCVADEVQVGFGRAGSHFWAFETQGVVPDILTLGKPIGNGHPLAAVITTADIADAFNNGMEYFNTFGGNPVSCAVGLAVLDVIAEEKLQENALTVGRRLQTGLQSLMAAYPLIGDVRGLGLFIGIELVLDRETLAPAAAHAAYIAERMKEQGILVSTDGPLHNVLKIKPPLVFSAENADFFVNTLDKILTEVTISWH
jgi:4-aminobutyrate aminotransferase-like enzyme